MAFTPRLSSDGMSGSKWYYGSNIFYQAGYGLPNCTCYAYGRYAEIRGSFANLPTGNATSWYDAATSFKRGTTPALGAIICWSSRSGSYGGHVAVVEQIDSNGNIVTSNSAWNGTYFYTASYSKSSGYYCGYHGGDYYFRGFIYNDATGTSTGSSIRTDFLTEALKHIGESGSWTWSTSGLERGQHWCAAFVVAVAKTVGILGKVIYNSFGAGQIAYQAVQRGWGTVIPGPYSGQKPIPQPGDLIQFRWGSRSYTYSGDADHVGIVLRVEGDNVITVEGNRGGQGAYGNTVQQKTYSLSYGCIFQYYRPNWTLVGDSGIFADPTGVFTGPLYDTESTEEDATMREVAYLSSSAKPSISTTSTRLSVVNYTSGLAALVNAYGGVTSSGTFSGNDNIDGLPSVPRQIVEYLVNKGLPTSAAIGIIANIKRESDFNTASVGDNGTSFGICQWHLGRGSAMKQMAGSNWASNLTGQLDYLWYELSTGTNWNGNISYFKNLPNTEAGARQAADYFVRKFEIPANVDNESALRQQYASEFWKMVVVNTSTSTLPGGSGGYSESQVSQLWNTVSTPSVNQLIQLGTSKGYSSDQITVALGWTEGEDGGGWYASKGQPYADYLYACIGLNWARKYGAQGFYNRMSAWGSYYNQSKVTNRGNNPSATTRKAMYLALNNLNDKVMYGNGVGSRPSTTFYTVYEPNGQVIWFSTG